MARAQISVELIARDTSRITNDIPRCKSRLSFVRGDSFVFVSVSYT